MNNFDLLKNPVEFVLPSFPDGDNTAQCYNKYPNDTNKKLCGEDVKKFYEEIINEPSENVSTQTDKQSINNSLSNDSATSVQINQSTNGDGILRKKKCKRKKDSKRKLEITKNINSPSIIYTRNMLLQAVQEDNIDVVKKCIEVGNIDINCVDQYNWTPLMIASYAGFKEIIDYLLLKGALWVDISDGSGYDARELANISGNTDIAEILSKRRTYVKHLKVKECKKCIEENIKKETAWCETCEYEYTVNNPKENEHHSSIVHQFSHRKKDKDDPKNKAHYFIQNSNKGYLLLKKHGWDESSGLGPSGTGSKYPVKTVLKRDRLGLGSKDANKARITHFSSHDKSAIKRPRRKSKNPPKTESKLMNKLNKKIMTEKEKRLKEKEIDFRLSFDHNF